MALLPVQIQKMMNRRLIKEAEDPAVASDRAIAQAIAADGGAPAAPAEDTHNDSAIATTVRRKPPPHSVRPHRPIRSPYDQPAAKHTAKLRSLQGRAAYGKFPNSS
eukprot:SAG11_NODE_4298_length_1965_cov_1.415863_3_plen_106_part_00